MALDLSKLNFFNRLSARARVLFLLAVVFGVILLVYFGTRWLSDGSKTTGPSRIASVPSGLQSVPGGTLTPEYQNAITQSNAQAAQQAQITGGSAVPTLINIGGQAASGGCIICAESSANVRNQLDDWARQGKIAPEVSQALQQLADSNVPVGDYAAALDQLVKEGKLTPEQARQLLAEYKKQHANKLLADSGKAMDSLIKSGQLPLSAANDLLAAQKANVTPAEYANLLQDLVRQGKISPAIAQQLLAQYSQQRAKEIVDQSISSLHQLARSGQISPEIESALVELESKMVPLDVYSNALQQYITAGKIIPLVANKILDEFKAQKAAIGPTGSISQMLAAAVSAAYAEVSELLKTGKISQDVANQLNGLIQRDVPFDEFQKVINQLVQQNKLTPDIAKLKIGDYTLIKGLEDESQRLADLQNNNATPGAYADELKRAVQAGLLTPAQAAQLMQEYLAAHAAQAPPVATGSGDFAKLQRAQQGAQVTTTVSPSEFESAAAQSASATSQDAQARFDALLAAMSGQAQQLIAAWQPPVMAYKAGAPVTVTTTTTKVSSTSGESGSGTPVTAETLGAGATLIKSGTILFAVLDTEANSDYPDSPILATIVEGPMKGAKLLGKLSVTTSNTGQMDRISLNFTLMNMDQWDKSKGVTAYAIDPDTARTVLASTVNYHYLMRFGAIMATSFLQGYANAITTSASTTTTGIFGTSTTRPEFSPSNKLMVGLGQVGQTLGAATQNYVNIPPTVRVDPGVSLGILFMADVT